MPGRGTLPGAALVIALLAAPPAALLAPPFAALAWLPPLGSPRINTSASLPRGLYWLAALRRPPRPGDLVLACPPAAAAALARERGYLAPGPCPGGTRPLGKLVLAAAGDRLVLTPSGIALNRCRLEASAVRAADTRGRPLPHVPAGAYRVRTGELWLFSPHPRSFDSRYFGPVAASAIRGGLSPVLVGPSRVVLHRWAARLRGCAARP